MSDLLIIVPSKRRPTNVTRLVDAIHATAAEPVDILVVVCSNEVTEYEAAIATFDKTVGILIVDDDFEYPQKLNAAAAATADQYRYLGLFNDDHVPESPGWDTKLKTALADDAFGVAYAPDGIWEDGQVPTAPLITSSMQLTLGWVALPGLHHILVDNVWKELAEACGTLHFLRDVRIQHHHRTNGLALDDQTYRDTADGNRAGQDSDRYDAWKQSGEKQANIDLLRGLQED